MHSHIYVCIMTIGMHVILSSYPNPQLHLTSPSRYLLLLRYTFQYHSSFSFPISIVSFRLLVFTRQVNNRSNNMSESVLQNKIMLQNFFLVNQFSYTILGCLGFSDNTESEISRWWKQKKKNEEKRKRRKRRENRRRCLKLLPETRNHQIERQTGRSVCRQRKNR